MTVASLRPGDRVPVPGAPGVFLTYLGRRHGKAVLGVEAPPGVGVHRGELHARLVADGRCTACRGKGSVPARLGGRAPCPACTPGGAGS